MAYEEKSPSCPFGVNIDCVAVLLLMQGVGVLVFDVLCDMNHACCQGQTGVSAKFFAPSDNGLL